MEVLLLRPENSHSVVYKSIMVVNDFIADENVVTKIMNNSTGFQHIEFTSFAKRHWKTSYYPVVYGWCLGLCWGLGLYL